MSLPPFATLDDLEAWLGQTPEDSARASAILAAASTLVRTETGSAWVDADGDLPWKAEGATNTLLLLGESLSAVVCAASARAYLNPSGKVSETAGPFSYQLPPEAGQGLFLTDTEKTSIRDAVALFRGSPTPGVWALGTTRGLTHDTQPVGEHCILGVIYLDTPDGDPIVWANEDQFF